MTFETLRHTTPDLVTQTMELDSADLEDRLAADRLTVDLSQPFATREVLPLMKRRPLPPGWDRSAVRRWCTELADAIDRFGSHALDAFPLHDVEAFWDVWGVPFGEAFATTPVGRVLREYFGIHRRDQNGESCADFAASNAEHMGPFLGRFASSVALSHWDLYAVETSSGRSATLRSLRDGDSLDVHATLHDQVFRERSFVIARVVSFNELTVATTVVPCAAESTIALLGELRRQMTGRSRHAFMRRQGARILLDGILRSLQSDAGSVRHRFRAVSRRDVIALHALHSSLEVAVGRGRLVSQVSAVGDVIGWVESNAEDVRFVVQRGERTWEFRRIAATKAADRDVAWLESMGLRPRLHGMIICDRDVPEWCIAAAETIITRLT